MAFVFVYGVCVQHGGGGGGHDGSGGSSRSGGSSGGTSGRRGGGGGGSSISGGGTPVPSSSTKKKAMRRLRKAQRELAKALDELQSGMACMQRALDGIPEEDKSVRARGSGGMRMAGSKHPCVCVVIARLQHALGPVEPVAALAVAEPAANGGAPPGPAPPCGVGRVPPHGRLPHGRAGDPGRWQPAELDRALVQAPFVLSRWGLHWYPA